MIQTFYMRLMLIFIICNKCISLNRTDRNITSIKHTKKILLHIQLNVFKTEDLKYNSTSES